MTPLGKTIVRKRLNDTKTVISISMYIKLTNIKNQSEITKPVDGIQPNIKCIAGAKPTWSLSWFETHQQESLSKQIITFCNTSHGVPKFRKGSGKGKIVKTIRQSTHLTARFK